MPVKNIVFACLTVLAALAFGYFFKRFIDAPAIGPLILLAVVSVVFLAVFLLQTMFLERFLLGIAEIILSVLALGLFFYGKLSLLPTLGMAAALVLLILAYRNGQMEIKNNLKINFFRISKYVTGLAATALAIFSTFAYLGLVDLQDPATGKQMLNVFIKPAEPIIGRYLPGFATGISLRQLAASSLPDNLKLAPEEVKNEFVQQVSGRLAELFSGLSGVAVKSGDKIIDIAYKATFGRLSTQSKLIQNLVLVIAALILFWTIKFALFFLEWLAAGLGYLVYQALWGAGFFRVELQSKSKEVIVME